MKNKLYLIIIFIVFTSLKVYSSDNSKKYLFETDDSKREISFDLSIVIDNKNKYGFFKSEAIGNSVLDSITIDENNIEFVSYLAGNYRIAGKLEKNNNDYIGILDVNGRTRKIKGIEKNEEVDNSRFDNNFSWLNNSNEIIVNSFEKGTWSLSQIDLKNNRKILFKSNKRIESPIINYDNSIIYYLQKDYSFTSLYKFDIHTNKETKVYDFNFRVVEISNTISDEQILLLTADGIKLFNNSTQSIRDLTNSKSDFAVRNSPQKNIFSFTSAANGNYDIYTYNLNNDNLTQLTKNVANNFNQRWSIDGKLLTFISWRDKNPEVYIMQYDGSNPQRITNNLARDNSPNFTNDNKSIYWVSRRDGNPEIYLSNIENPKPLNLTNNKALDENPLISYDDKHMAFLSDRNGNRKVYILELLNYKTFTLFDQ